ncbi:MAG: class I tRNA ligase family protein, partial [Gammaproteobacteria bacterium]|nr:class I tRNA ligase family protein [Gammaproteobacteria bacterium]
TFAALASSSREIRFDLARVGGYRNFCNKLWNAARFVTLALGDGGDGPAADGPAAGADAPGELTLPDRWIRSRFGRTLGAVESALAEYRFDHAASALYDFTWHDFCDWYVELAKPVLQNPAAGPAMRRGTQHTLAGLTEALQRALHPLMPFITEEIWQRVAPLAGRRGETVMRQPYPRAEDFPADEAAEREIAWLQAVVLGVRQIRGEMNISPGKRIAALLKDANPGDAARARHHRASIQRLAGLESLELLAAGSPAPPSAVALVGELSVLVPMKGLIDPKAEAERLGKLLTRARSELEKVRGRLANGDFVRGAPPEVVATERERFDELVRAVSGLSAQLERVRAVGAP